MSIVSSAQVEISNWFFGDSCHLKFTPDSVYHYKSGLIISEGSSSISDSAGNVIFYTNGIDVLDADHQKINTQQLKAFFSCIQPALVIPINDSAYIITTASPDSGVYFYTLIKRDSFVIVDPEGIKLLNGYIKTPQNITGTTEGQHAVNHQNNIFTWFTARQFNGLYNLFLCTENGVVCCPKTSKTYKSTTWDVQQDRFSPSGKYLISGIPGSVNLFKFDQQTGVVLVDSIPGPVPIYGPITISMQGSTAFTIALSPDENFLYANINGQKIYQFDIREYDVIKINDSRRLIYDSSPKITVGAMQITPYGNELAVAMYDSNYLALIHNPDSPFVSGNFEMRGIFLGNDRISHFGLPEFNASYYYHPPVDFSYETNCFTNSYDFDVLNSISSYNYYWSISALSSSDSWQYNGKQVTHVFGPLDSLERQFQVQLIATNGTESDTMTKVLTVYEPIDPNFLGKDTVAICNGEAIVLRTPQNLHCIHWNGEEPNLDSNKDPMYNYGHFHTDTLYVDTPGIYIAKITHKTFCQIWDTIIIVSDTNPDSTTITQNRDSLFSSAIANSYRWYRNNVFYSETDTPMVLISEKGTYYVELVSKYGCVTASKSIIVDNVGLNEPYPVAFKMYPNPSKGIVHLEFSEPGEYKVKVYDMQGREIEHKNLDQTPTNLTIDLPKSSGRYLIRVINSNGSSGTRMLTIGE